MLVVFVTLLYELLGDEESSQIKQLPCGQPKQAQNGENTEIQHTGVCRLCKTKQNKTREDQSECWLFRKVHVIA